MRFVGLEGRESQVTPLLLPVWWEIVHALETGRGQLYWLVPIQIGLDDVRRQKCERQYATDVSLINGLNPGELTY